MKYLTTAAIALGVILLIDVLEELVESPMVSGTLPISGWEVEFFLLAIGVLFLTWA